MRNLIKDVQKIAGDDQRQDLENIPTQIVAEYLQHPVSGQQIQRVLWRSVKDCNVTCCVLFIGRETLTMPGTETAGAMLEMLQMVREASRGASQREVAASAAGLR